VHPEFANTSLCNSVSYSRTNGNPQILGFYTDSHLRGNDTDICKSGMLPKGLGDEGDLQKWDAPSRCAFSLKFSLPNHEPHGKSSLLTQLF
jgi:hypothetical protein